MKFFKPISVNEMLLKSMMLLKVNMICCVISAKSFNGIPFWIKVLLLQWLESDFTGSNGYIIRGSLLSREMAVNDASNVIGSSVIGSSSEPLFSRDSEFEKIRELPCFFLSSRTSRLSVKGSPLESAKLSRVRT